MIEKLDGTLETVVFHSHSAICLYDNVDFEAYPPHWHTPVEIIMSVRSPYPVTCDGVSYLLNEGDMLMIAPGVIHHMPAIEGERLIFQAEFFPLRFISEIDQYIAHMPPAICIRKDQQPEIQAQAAELMLGIQEEYFAGRAFHDVGIYSRLLALFALIFRENTAVAETRTKSKQQEYTYRFAELCDYIVKHLSDSLSLEQCAEQVGFSKYHFSRLFKQYLGCTFYQYINDKRIALAQELLFNQMLTVTDIAEQCGFSSLSAFNRMFKQLSGCTPSEFRICQPQKKHGGKASKELSENI